MLKWLRFSDDYIRWECDIECFPWLLEGEIPADLLADLNTKSNKLSLWLIDDSAQNLNRILAAHGAVKSSSVEIGYILFDCNLLRSLKDDIHKSKGTLIDVSANENWHFDLEKLSSQKILWLASIIFTEGNPGVITENKKYELIAQSIKKGLFDRKNIHQRFLPKLDEFLQID